MLKVGKILSTNENKVNNLIIEHFGSLIFHTKNPGGRCQKDTINSYV